MMFKLFLKYSFICLFFINYYTCVSIISDTTSRPAARIVSPVSTRSTEKQTNNKQQKTKQTNNWIKLVSYHCSQNSNSH